MADQDSSPRNPFSQFPFSMPRFQFSLFRMMVAVTLVAVLLFFAVTVGGLLGTIFEVAIWGMLPTPFVICAIFGRGDSQAFSIGALVPWFALLMDHSMISRFTADLWLIVLVVICGILAVGTRRWIDANVVK